MRLAGEEFDREFKLKFQELENAADRQSLAAGSRSGGSFAKGFLGAAALGALGAAIGNAISSAADLGTEILNTSRQFNIGAEELQVWRQAASNAGVSANDFNGTLASLTQKIGEANAGNRQAQQSFVDLGVGFQTTAGQARATDAVMLDLAARIAAIEDPAERSRLATQLLGDDFKTLYPLLLDAADGLDHTRAEMDRLGVTLSAKEIQDLDRVNKNIEEMKDQLSRRVDQVVAQNADSINVLADELFRLADASVKATGDFIKFLSLESRYRAAVGNLPRDLSPAQRESAVAGLGQRFGRRETVTGSYLFGAIKTKDVRFVPSPYTDWAGPGAFLSRYPGAQDVAEPVVTGGGGGGRRSGGGGGGAGRTRRDPAEIEAERAAKKAIDEEKAFREAVARTLRAQEDSAKVQRIRSELGEEAAARAEAELGIQRQIPLAAFDTVDALAKALGITGEINDEKRAQLQLDIDAANLAEKNAGNAAALKAREDLAAAKDRADKDADAKAKREADRYAAEYERAILDVASIYETAFSGGTKELWSNFKDEGTRIIAEIAAQWTLSLIAGQPFNFNAAAGGAFGRSPLASIFFGAGGGAANDNGFPGFNGGIFGGGGGLSSKIANNDVFQGGGGLSGSAIRLTLGEQAAQQRRLEGLSGVFQQGITTIGLSQLGIAIGGNSGTTGQIGGTLGGLAGSAVGGPIGAIIGSTLGNLLGGLLKSTKRASVTVGNAGGTLGITGRQGNSSSRDQTATAGAGSLIDAIFSIAEQLGGGVDASRGSVSLGIRKDNFRVDTSGRGITKTSNGAVDFGSDQEAAIRFAIQDLIKDGVITGISQASQNLLQRGGDLEAQIEKALLIESVPRLLKERLDPLGAALDDLNDRFKKLNDALREGGASAEQLAEAQRLYELEKADAIASIGAASQTLQDFLASLNAGSNSPLSLREQRAEAERQFEPFLAQITAAEQARAEVERLRSGGGTAAQIAAAEEAARAAAAAINQDGFTQASQLLLSISRQSNASSGAFFSDFDRIRALTGQAIGFVDQGSAQATDARDPFARETAQNTKDAAYILGDLAAESRAQGETLRQIAAALSGGEGSEFIREARAFTR